MKLFQRFKAKGKKPKEGDNDAAQSVVDKLHRDKGSNMSRRSGNEDKMILRMRASTSFQQKKRRIALRKALTLDGIQDYNRGNFSQTFRVDLAKLSNQAGWEGLTATLSQSPSVDCSKGYSLASISTKASILTKGSGSTKVASTISVLSSDSLSSQATRVGNGEAPRTAILKILDPCYFPVGYQVPDVAEELFNNEVTAYTYFLRDLQGTVVPRMYGNGYLEAEDFDIRGHFLLLEDIGTVRPTPGMPSRRWYYDRAIEALQSIHNRGLAHLDIKANNMGIRGDGTIVVFDFGRSVQLARCEFGMYAPKIDLKRLDHIFGRYEEEVDLFAREDMLEALKQQQLSRESTFTSKEMAFIIKEPSTTKNPSSTKEPSTFSTTYTGSKAAATFSTTYNTGIKESPSLSSTVTIDSKGSPSLSSTAGKESPSLSSTASKELRWKSEDDISIISERTEIDEEEDELTEMPPPRLRPRPTNQRPKSYLPRLSFGAEIGLALDELN
ncbi:hypothetical protein TRVA0_001S09516 [Trichomonascus vanleenenianus]|uniref:uncharacterized protein n=1 Tax=Trichomonascus vanleenenianus TaxID=2268995 RepID=UPI003ECB13FD